MASVVFVCLGNINRSPAAEAVFKSIIASKARNAEDAAFFRVESRGTGGGNPNWYKQDGWSFHEGEPADPRMSAAAEKRGYLLTSVAEPLTEQDIQDFDYIVCMDESNRLSVLEAAKHWAGDEGMELADRKIHMLCDSCRKFPDVDRVPDPYYEGGFEYVLDILEDACGVLYQTVVVLKKAGVP